MDLYLADLAVNGGHELACAAANIHQADARAAIDGDPVLADEVDAAHEYFCALCEWQSLAVGRVKGNPLPFFARLKADRPARYIERAQIQSVNLSAGIDVSPAEAKAMLAHLLGAATPTTRAEIAAMGGLPALEQAGQDADGGESPAG